MKTAVGLVAIVAALMLAVPTTWSQQVFTNALVDEINCFDQQAVIRQARENR